MNSTAPYTCPASEPRPPTMDITRISIERIRPKLSGVR
ncbi:Uncharacterised protein [Bordetella pertussis]|nr:Uncharacterised protein [Bordetella pertussis]CFW37596.1 Uncharacterised protein [Bordetella pertussis]CPO24879.1 Uncharacterised protein [Bordetella pertussis]